MFCLTSHPRCQAQPRRCQVNISFISHRLLNAQKSYKTLINVVFSRCTGQQAGHSKICAGHIKVLVQARHLKGSGCVCQPSGIIQRPVLRQRAALKLCLSSAAISVLKDKEPGCFIIRDSHSFRGAYGLAMKVATPPPSVLQQSKKGRVF